MAKEYTDAKNVDEENVDDEVMEEEGNEEVSKDGSYECYGNPTVNPEDYGHNYYIDSSEDVGVIEFLNLDENEMEGFNFSDVDVAFEFYNAYAKSRGFSERKSKTQRLMDGELVKKEFVCYYEGYKPEKYYNLENCKMEPRAETRCVCKAMIQVWID